MAYTITDDQVLQLAERCMGSVDLAKAVVSAVNSLGLILPENDPFGTWHAFPLVQVRRTVTTANGNKYLVGPGDTVRLGDVEYPTDALFVAYGECLPVSQIAEANPQPNLRAFLAVFGRDRETGEAVGFPLPNSQMWPGNEGWMYNPRRGVPALPASVAGAVVSALNGRTFARIDAATAGANFSPESIAAILSGSK